MVLTTNPATDVFYASAIEQLLASRAPFDQYLSQHLTIDTLLKAGLCVPLEVDASMDTHAFMQYRTHWMKVIFGDVANSFVTRLRHDLLPSSEQTDAIRDATAERSALEHAELQFLSIWPQLLKDLQADFASEQGNAPFYALITLVRAYGELFDLGAYILYTFTKQVSDIHLDGVMMTLVTSSNVTYRATLPAYPTLDGLLERADRYAQYFGKRFDSSSAHENLHSSHFHRLALRRNTTLFSGFAGAFRIQLLDNPMPMDLVNYGFISIEAMNFLQRAVRAEVSILVAGEAGSAKTTLLRTLSRCIDRNEPILTVEESPELFLRMAKDVSGNRYFANVHDHIIQGPNANGDDTADFASILKWALQESCRRMIIGEIPNGEIMSNFIMALSGHGSGMATLHASDINNVVDRVTTLLATIGTPSTTAWRQIEANLSVVVHSQLQHTPQGTKRFITGIGWIVPNPSSADLPPAVLTAFTRGPDGYLRAAPTLPRVWSMLQAAEQRVTGSSGPAQLDSTQLLFPN